MVNNMFAIITAMRASLTVVMIANMLLTMALWGVESGARFGG
jgi:phospholipid/cholesterol/gamma-HCH transport system permease protein